MSVEARAVFAEPPQIPSPQDINNATDEVITGALTELFDLFHSNSAAHGFWEEPRNVGEMIALMHSELSEMLEGFRKPGPDDHCPEFDSSIIEAADLFIRFGDFVNACFGTQNFINAVNAKMQYNAARPPKHGKAF